MKYRLIILSILLLWICHAATANGATYYISPAGNDASPGTTPSRAWKTSSKVNQFTFSPGDRILFEGGKTFSGPVKFDIGDGGNPECPIVVGSYQLEDAGPATILAGEGIGIDVYNTSGLHITDLKIVGAGAKANHDSGVSLLSTLPQGACHIMLENLDISGFGKHGISIGAWETRAGYNNVTVIHCISHDNLRTGIYTWGPWGTGIYAHSKIYVGYCEAFGMKGGSGITLSSVNGGIVERTLAHNNGEEFSGGAGIWAWDSNDILFQFNESYKNRTTDVDGDGFDLDGGVTNSVMQYNYSHDNDAAGFLLAQYIGAPQAMRNIVIRYNISENDCRKNGYGAIHVWNGERRDRISEVQIYQNTVFLSSSPADASAIAIVTPTKSVAVRNNIFYTSGGTSLVSVVPDQEEIVFQNNAYWSGRDQFHVKWYDVDYGSLAAWLRAADNQERIGTRILAVHTDPMLENPGGGGTLRRVDNLSALSAYRLKAGSPLARRGLNLLNAFGIHPGKHGFFGIPISRATIPSIGAQATASAYSVKMPQYISGVQ